MGTPDNTVDTSAVSMQEMKVSDRQEKKYTVGELLSWLETAPSWAGDDFEECLEYVNRVRK